MTNNNSEEASKVSEDVDNQSEEIPKKVSKIDEKRARAYEERRRRLINQGVPSDKVDLRIAQEDYVRLPPDKKIARLEAILTQSISQIAQDIASLQHNDRVIADAMDVNMRAMSKCLDKVGLSMEQQAEIMRMVQDELLSEMNKQSESVAQDITEQSIEQSLTSAEKGIVSPESQGATIPSEATVFGDNNG